MQYAKNGHHKILREYPYFHVREKRLTAIYKNFSFLVRRLERSTRCSKAFVGAIA
jgi:hypothetical protein